MTKQLKYSEAGATVIAWRIDRLGRSRIDVPNTVDILRGRGGHRRSLSYSIDPATSTGRLILRMLATLAEYERELIVKRINAGIAVARESGTQFGRPPVDDLIAEKHIRVVL